MVLQQPGFSGGASLLILRAWAESCVGVSLTGRSWAVVVSLSFQQALPPADPCHTRSSFRGRQSGPATLEIVQPCCLPDPATAVCEPPKSLQALRKGGSILGNFPIRVSPSKTAIVPVNNT